MYAVNIEPHVKGRPETAFESLIDVDEHYVAEMHDRALVLKEDPLRCQSLPHMTLAGWDLLELLMEQQAAGYPEHFELHRDGNRWRWINRPLGIDDSFIFGDESTLPYGPMEYITRQSQGDFCILDQRDGNLWMDAGIVTTQADWSLDFDIGMNFMEWHAPVPRAHEMGVFDRALKFMLNLRQGQPMRRFNWTMTVNPRLDTSPENYHKWGTDRTTVTPENVGRKVHLRVELQSFWRLPRSNAIVFPIRCYLLALDELVDRAEVGAAHAPRAARPARRPRDLQGPDPLASNGARLPGAIRRRRADVGGFCARVTRTASAVNRTGSACDRRTATVVASLNSLDRRCASKSSPNRPSGAPRLHGSAKPAAGSGRGGRRPAAPPDGPHEGRCSHGLFEPLDVGELRRQGIGVIPREEQERDAAHPQHPGDVEGRTLAQVDVQHGAVRQALPDGSLGICDGREGSENLRIRALQDGFDLHGQQIAVLHHHHQSSGKARHAWLRCRVRTERASV